MGKTIRVAAQASTAHAASVPISMVLRKVQVVRASSLMGTANTPLSSFVGLNDGVDGAAYDVFYIELSPVDGKWARVSL
jgi:hypothetical protein